MKNSTLVLFAVVMLIGWTLMAAGVLAVFAGQPDASRRSHHHLEHREPQAPMRSDAPCDAEDGRDASVPCPA